MAYKYSLVSDLHLDHQQPKTPPLEENVIVAGDCGNGLIGLKYLNKLKRKGHKVFAIDGNHEHYANVDQGRSVSDTDEAFYEGLEQGNTRWVTDDLMIIGTNGWYCVSMGAAWRNYMSDSRFIGIDPSEMNVLALNSAMFIDSELRGLAKGQRAIVVTHTAPTMATLDPRFEGQFSNEWYWNPHMEQLLVEHSDRIAVWNHGHTHAPADKIVHGVRVVCNPRGYPRENPEWSPLTIEIESC